MNSIYCMALGTYMLAAVARHKEDWNWFLVYFVSATIAAWTGGLK